MKELKPPKETLPELNEQVTVILRAMAQHCEALRDGCINVNLLKIDTQRKSKEFQARGNGGRQLEGFGIAQQMRARNMRTQPAPAALLLKQG